MEDQGRRAHSDALARSERDRAIADAGFNTFLLRSEDVYIDLLTDSGNSAMSDRQWAGMMLGDEAYAGSRNFYHLEAAVRTYYGYHEVIPTHQGRGAEHIISKLLITPGDHVPGNMYFTTTRVHQELAGGTFHDVIIDEAHDPSSEHPFKGDVDLAKLDAIVQRYGAERIPYVSVAATVNLAGGQPISIANLRLVRSYTQQHGIRLILDATRAVENAFFVQQREPGFRDKTVAEILLEICSLTDGATMSAKKDSLVNIGGWLGLRDPDLAAKARNLVVVYEGLHTYGGLAGRDMEAMAIGIEESVQEDHVRTRIGQVHYLGRNLIVRRHPDRPPHRRPRRVPRCGGDSARTSRVTSVRRRRSLPRSMCRVACGPWSAGWCRQAATLSPAKTECRGWSSCDSRSLAGCTRRLTWTWSPRASRRSSTAARASAASLSRTSRAPSVLSGSICPGRWRIDFQRRSVRPRKFRHLVA